MKEFVSSYSFFLGLESLRTNVCMYVKVSLRTQDLTPLTPKLSQPSTFQIFQKKKKKRYGGGTGFTKPSITGFTEIY